MEALVKACSDDPFIDFRLVFSNKPTAAGLAIAQGFGIETLAFRKKDCGGSEAFDKRIIQELRKRDIDIICLAGFMAIISPTVVQAFPNRILNIHPTLLPSFPGLDVHQRAIDHGVKFSGCTVHFVDDGVDTGAIIVQNVVPVLDDDTAQTLASRIIREEHTAYPQALKLVCQEQIEIHERRVLKKDV